MRAALARLGVVAVLAVLLFLVLSSWANRVMSDPDDQCNDTDSPWIARQVVCHLEGK